MSGSTKIWALSAALMGVSIALILTVVPHLPDSQDFVVPTAAVAILFAAAEVWVVHVQLRREAHSFSLSELPLIIGLFYLTPFGLIFAQVAGAGFALLVHRRQSALKAAFNISHFSLEIVLATILFRTAVGQPDIASGLHMFVAFVTALFTTTLALGLIFVAISLSEGGLQFAAFPRAVSIGAVTTITNASIALIAVTLLQARATAVWLLIVPSATVFLAYRGYMTQRERHESIEFLHESTKLISQTPELEAAIISLLDHARRMFKGEIAEITLRPSQDATDALCTRLGPGDEVHRMTTVVEASADAVDSLLSDGRAVLLDPGHPSLPRAYGGVRVKDVLAAPLMGETRTIGRFMVVNRSGDVGGFGGDDLKLFEMLANHTSIALQNGRLEKSLAHLTELKEQLRHQAFHDPLTGLANRALFADRVTHAMSNAGREEVAVALLLIDLDDFKTVNDSLGHQAGDVLLVDVATRLREQVRPPDTVARLGGDEFAILIEDSAPDHVVSVARRIVRILDDPFPIAGREVSVHASIGVVFGSSDASAEELMRNADIAMYRAKARGKGRFEIYEPQMHAAAVERLEIKAELGSALEGRDLGIAYQPIVELSSGRPVEVEALARWPARHPEIGPNEFIPLAEETGLIERLGEWVLWQSCLNLRAWSARSEAGRELGLSVNLSARQLQRADLCDELRAILSASGIEPERLTLEISETSLVREGDVTVHRLNDLKRLGVRLALDDFGTGYSSLSYLKYLPIDVLKLDRALVSGVATDAHDGAIVSAVISLARTLDLVVVAEGIETEEQAAILREMGCRYGQGFHLGYPVPAADIQRLLVRAPEREAPMQGMRAV